MRERLKTAPEGEKAEVETQITAAEKSLDDSQDHFAALAVGGVNLGADEGEIKLDWQTELLEIAKPVVSSLKALTKKPRIMDRLRAQIELLEDNLVLIDKALASLERTAASDLQPGVTARVDAEVVQLRDRGAVRDVPTASFLGMAKNNLSLDGFMASVTFGIDYAHQDICLDQVTPRFLEAVEGRLRTEYGDQLVSVHASFKEAAINSMDYLIIAAMQPGAAADYFAIKRAIQQACVTVCNTQGWGIPFPQLAIHAGEGLQVPETTPGLPVV